MTQPQTRTRSTSSDPDAGRRDRNKREKRSRIHRAARALFLERGFEGATARQVAEQAGIGTGTLFLYARDKRDLLLLVFDDEIHGLIAQGLAGIRDDDSLPAALMRVYRPIFRFYAAHQELARPLLGGLLFAPPHAAPGIGAAREFASQVARIVARARQRGEIAREVSVAAAARACVAHFAFWVEAWLASDALAADEAEARLEEALALQMSGLRPRPLPE